MMMPIGTFLTKMDTMIVVGMDQALLNLVPWVRAPIMSMCAFSLASRGVRVVQGDGAALHGMWMHFVKIALVIALATNLGNYNTYVRDAIYNQVPSFLNNAVAGQVVRAGIEGTAATFDSLWSQMWVQVSNVWAASGTLDVGSKLGAMACAVTIGAALMAMAGVYLLARLLLGILLVLGAPAIGCTLFESSKGVFERWMGTCISMVCLQVTGVVLIQILLTGNLEFMAQMSATGAIQANQVPGMWSGGAVMPTMASDIQNLVSMVIWFGMGAFAMYALPALAYSIGGGIAISTVPIMAGMVAAAGAAISGGTAAAAAISNAGGGGGGGGISLSMPGRPLPSGGNGGALPAPPPPALAPGSRA